MLVLQIVFSYILFLIALIVTFYLPGVALLSWLKIRFSSIEKYIFAWVVGYSLFIFLSYISAWIHLPYISLVVSIFLTVYVVVTRKSSLSISLPKGDKLIIGLIIIGSLSFVSMSFFSGLETHTGIQFIGNVNFTDAVMHVARIKTQTYAFPPIYTGFSGYTVRGYHYFYDFLLSRFALFYRFSAEDLYYRLFPLFISMMYGGVIYLFSTRFTKKNIELIWVLFFAYFAQGFGYVLSFFTNKVDAANGMGLVQPQQLVLDPSSIFAVALLLAGSYLLLEKKLTIWHALLAGLILGLLAQLKVYAGIIAVGMLIVLVLYRLLTKKEAKWHVVTLIIVLLLIVITYFPNNFGVGKLIFSPFFLYESFIKLNPIFDSWNWDLRMILYREHHNIPHIIFMYISAAILFWVLALGARVIIFLKIQILCKKAFWAFEPNVLLTLLIVMPLAIASIFVQSISIADTVQFLWIVGILLCMPAGIFYGQLIEKLPRIGGYVLIGVVIFLSLGSFLSDESKYVFHPEYKTISSLQMNVVNKIQQTLSQNDFLIISPSYVLNHQGQRNFEYYPGPIFADLTGRKTYYEYEIPVFPDDKAITYRKNQIQAITLDLEQCNENAIVSSMGKIGTIYILTTSEVRCKKFSHMQQLARGGKWTFWKLY